MTLSLYDFLSSADELIVLLAAIEQRHSVIRDLLAHALPMLPEDIQKEFVARLRVESGLVQREIDRAADILHRITTVPFCS